MNERERRVGVNEALFREVNERIESIHEELGPQDDAPIDFICECGDAACTKRVAMTLKEYESLRADSTTFAVVPGHAESSVEQVVARRGAYDVIRKRPGEPALLAERESPR